MLTKHVTAKGARWKAGGEPGSFSILFSTFNTIDDGGDVVEPSFFTDGQEIPLAAWGHNWDVPNVGKGVIRVTDEGAALDGQYNLATQAGRDAYETAKFNGDLQEYSFGYKVTDFEYGQLGGQRARFLKAGETYEACQVLVGMNRETRTLALKQRKGLYVDEPPEGSYEDIAEDIAEVLPAQLPQLADALDYVAIIATYPGYAYVCIYDGDAYLTHEEPQTYWRIDYQLDANGDPVLSNPAQVEPQVVFGPVDPTELSFAGRTRSVHRKQRVRAALKEGRAISGARMDRLGEHVKTLRGMADDMQGMLDDAAPKDDGKAQIVAEVARYYEIMARLNGE